MKLMKENHFIKLFSPKLKKYKCMYLYNINDHFSYSSKSNINIFFLSVYEKMTITIYIYIYAQTLTSIFIFLLFSRIKHQFLSHCHYRLLYKILNCSCQKNCNRVTYNYYSTMTVFAEKRGTRDRNVSQICFSKELDSFIFLSLTDCKNN